MSCTSFASRAIRVNCRVTFEFSKESAVYKDYTLYMWHRSGKKAYPPENLISVTYGKHVAIRPWISAEGYPESDNSQVRNAAYVISLCGTFHRSSRCFRWNPCLAVCRP